MGKRGSKKGSEAARKAGAAAIAARNAHKKKWGGSTMKRAEETKPTESMYYEVTCTIGFRSSWARSPRLAEERTPKWWRK